MQDITQRRDPEVLYGLIKRYGRDVPDVVMSGVRRGRPSSKSSKASSAFRKAICEDAANAGFDISHIDSVFKRITGSGVSSSARTLTLDDSVRLCDTLRLDKTRIFGLMSEKLNAAG